MKKQEAEIQKNIVLTLNLMFKDSLVFAVPNGGFRNAIEAANLKRQGVVPGVSDLIFIHNKKIYFIEVKSKQGTQSLFQKQFQKFVESQGFAYWLVRDTHELIKKIENETKKN